MLKTAAHHCPRSAVPNPFRFGKDKVHATVNGRPVVEKKPIGKTIKVQLVE